MIFLLLICAAFTAAAQTAAPADQPVARTDENSQIAHSQLLEKARRGGIDVYFEGDSIARRWGATDYPDMLANWKQNFFGWNAADFGWGGDRTQNILWRLHNGELENGDLKWSIDFRSIYATLLDQWLNVPAEAVLGGQFATVPVLS